MMTRMQESPIIYIHIIQTIS